MTARIEPGDQVKIARAAGKAGKAQPEWSKADPELDAAYREGAGIPPAAPKASPPAGDDASTPPVKHPQTHPSRKGGTRSPGKPPAAPAKISRATRAKQADAGARQATRSFLPSGGDGAGLMLAVFFYPLGLAILQHGPSGLGIWLKAKFLNQVTAKPGSKPATPPPTQNTSPSLPNYVPPRPPGWKGQWPPPGTPTPGPSV